MSGARYAESVNRFHAWKRMLFASASAFVASSPLVSGAPVINEVMTANLSSIEDDFERDPGACPVDDCEAWFAAMGTSTNDGDNPDWIEIYNPDTVSVDLSGYALSDDTQMPRRWSIPSMVLAPHGYVVFFATGKDRAGTPCWHANFSLTEGEPVILTAPDGRRCDSVSTSGVPPDMSAGRRPDGSGPWAVFIVPTPGSANTTAPFPGFSDTVTLTPSPGLYAGPLQVRLLSRSPGAHIRFTLDGSDPAESSALYTEAISIDSTTVIKARTYGERTFTSRIAFGTYVTDGYTLPVFSISTPPGNLWDSLSGIYTPGAHADEANRIANYWQNWERPAHVEWCERGRVAFGQDCGISIDGWGTQAQPRKSLKVSSDDRYGSSWFNHRFFSDLPFEKYQCLVLRAGNDWDGALLRDPLVAVLAPGLGLDFSATRPVILLINGAYWGVYDLRENVNRSYFATHYGLGRDSIDIIRNYWRFDRPEVSAGDSAQYLALDTFLTNNSLSGAPEYARAATLMDVDNFATYNAVETIVSNYDWPGNNNKCWRPRTAGALWKWILYDLDYTFQFQPNAGPSYDMLAHATSTGTGWPVTARTSLVQRRLFENADFAELFVNRCCDLMNTRLSADTMIAALDSLAALYAPEMPRHIERWKTQSKNVRSVEDWNRSVEKIRTFIRARPPYAREHIKKKFGLAGVRRLTFRIEPAGAGVVRLNSITLTGSVWSGDYFASVPIRLAAQPAAGYRFAQWSGLSLPDSLSSAFSFDPLTDMTVIARFATDSGSCNAVVINEINYHSADTFDSGDWVELYNGYSVPVTISKWTFHDSDPSHGFVFASGTVIPAGGYLVLCADTALFRKRFPRVTVLAGQMAFGLDGNGEHVRLTDAQGRIVDSLTYGDLEPWPTAADGHGATIELRDLSLDNARAQNWRASDGNGTPGAPNGGKGTAFPKRRDGYSNVLAVKAVRSCTGSAVLRFVFDVPRTGRVVLRVYGLNGRPLATLCDRECAPGRYCIAWDGRERCGRAASGVWAYTIRQGTAVVTGRIAGVR